MPKFRLDPDIKNYMNAYDCNEIEAANALQMNLDEIYDVVSGRGHYDFDTDKYI